MSNAQAKKALLEMFQTGQIAENLYHKSLVDLAHKCVLDEDMSGCLDALESIKPEYYVNQQMLDMQEDAGYAEICVSLAYKLVLFGAVNEETAKPTQNMAEA